MRKTDALSAPPGDRTLDTLIKSNGFTSSFHLFLFVFNFIIVLYNALGEPKGLLRLPPDF